MSILNQKKQSNSEWNSIQISTRNQTKKDLITSEDPTGNLQEYLDLDLSLGSLHLQILNYLANIELREVITGDPQEFLKREQVSHVDISKPIIPDLNFPREVEEAEALDLALRL